MKKYVYNKDELISEVENMTDVGKTIMKIQMEYLWALSRGEIYEEDF